MFFAGRLPKPPWDTRGRVEALVKQYDRAHIQNFGDRFRFNRCSRGSTTFVDLWDRGLRAREEGRPGPFPVQRTDKPDAAQAADRIASCTSRRSRIRCARWIKFRISTSRSWRRGARAVEDAVPFHKFAALVKSRSTKLRSSDGSPVAFRVVVKDGKVSFTARALKGGEGEWSRGGAGHGAGGAPGREG